MQSRKELASLSSSKLTKPFGIGHLGCRRRFLPKFWWETHFYHTTQKQGTCSALTEELRVNDSGGSTTHPLFETEFTGNCAHSQEQKEPEKAVFWLHIHSTVCFHCTPPCPSLSYTEWRDHLGSTGQVTR